MASPSDPSLLSNPSLPPTETASDAQEDAVNVQGDAGNLVATSALDTLKGPAPSLEAYANFNSIAPPTLLRSERRQAGKKEFVTSCSKLEEILQQALGLSESIPVPPATIISGLREMHEQCRKRKQDVSKGKPIPPEDLIDLTNEPDDNEDMGKFPQGVSAVKPPIKRRRMDEIQPLAKSEGSSSCSRRSPPTTQHTTGVPPDPAGLSTPATQTAIGPELATSQSSATLTGEGADPTPSIPSSTAPKGPIIQATPSSTAPDVHPNTSNASSTIQAGAAPGTVSASNQPVLLPPPPPPLFLLKPASDKGPNTDPTATADLLADPSTNPSTNPPTNLSGSAPQPSTTTFILDDVVRAEVHSILQTFQGNLNRHKFKQAYQAVHEFIDCRAQSMHKRSPPPAFPQFSLVQSESSHNAWLKEISKYLETLLLPANDEPWYAPGLINIPNIKAANLAELKAEGHVEYPLALLLLEIQKPSKFYLSRWSNCIASSIQLTAQQFAVKPTSLGDLNNDNLDSHLRILEYLNGCKTSASNSEDGKMRNDMTLKPLYQLHNTIIDIFITYSIIRGSVVADVEPDATSPNSQALVVQKKELDKHRSRHNYTPFCLYLVAGVRGLILASHNRQFISGASALGFLSAVEHIFTKNIPRREGLEPIWRRLGAYIDGLFIDSFLTPNCLFSFHQPQILQLAQAITSDFLLSVQNQFPSQNFKIPRAITVK
ncbi:hypothetical protein MJO28_011279 [Puccinia striiformis f. sp. tritici]|uniref:Uncharacterized protein n=1 Tax=Puccinia striiformis f. sp. tritici TaxID=168172 RepID=A0ACC0E294_9BASI|nr:hypothetical protein MJO28_011279 [Puccinia striiformis f. sp. tritici]